MCLRSLLIGVLACQLLGSQPAAAQQVAVQQPAVGVFQVNTTVSVPDRGSTFLGGVRSAAGGRSSFGPLRSGSSLGMNREASSASVHVFIQDLQAMDEALLAAAESPRISKLDPQLVSRLEQRGRSMNASSDQVADDVPPAANAERLAEQAESRGKFAVAKLHWQRAARHGSVRAAAQLAEQDHASAKRR